MIDHNEASQSVEGIEQAEVIEILITIELAQFTQITPFMFCQTRRSSCTIVYSILSNTTLLPLLRLQHCYYRGFLSDTIILRSPTTTPQDTKAAEELAAISALDIQEWENEIFHHAASLKLCKS
jgi:manganese-dependent inorganic pyrophosphatase